MVRSRIAAVLALAVAAGLVAPVPVAPALGQAAAPASEADAREVLDGLFGRLRTAKDAETGQLIEKAIWELWNRSGSATCDALMGQAAKATEASSYGLATGLLATVLDLQPDFAEGWNRRATVYFLMRDFDRSLADIDRVLELEPRHFGALAGLGTILREKGDGPGALRAYRRARAIHPFMDSVNSAIQELEREFDQKI